MKRTSKTALTLAAAAAALFATGCSSLCSEPCEALVKCCGTSSCKGSGHCASPKSGCKGQSAHNGKNSNISYMTRSECLAAGGTVVE